MALPRILLLGAGRFGQHYVRVLSELAEAGMVEFSGIVVASEASAQVWRRQPSLTVYTALTDLLLAGVDTVIIATPPETHFELVKQCLLYCDVFVEKPMTETEVEAQELVRLAKETGHALTVGHIFRAHPVTLELEKVVSKRGVPSKIKAEFLNPIATDQGRPIALELLHMFDVVDALWQPVPVAVHSTGSDRLVVVDVRYQDFCDARIKLGFTGDERVRTVSIEYVDARVDADYSALTITITTAAGVDTIVCTGEEPLKLQTTRIVTKDAQLVPGEIGARIVSLAAQVNPVRFLRPKVAVIGAGIFGVETALALSEFCDVTVFERNAAILDEGTRVNQYRHHAGYHYPRSDETVLDVQRSKAAFEAIYEEAIIRNIPAYYALAREGSHVSPEEFLAFCDKHGLPYEVVENEHFTPEQVALTVKVDEPSYHFETMRKLAEERLVAASSVQLRLESEVVRAELHSDGTKQLTYKDSSKTLHTEQFDCVVNTAYAFINDLTTMLHFPYVPIRIDVAEVLIVSIPIEPVSLTVIDGPFATVLPTGNPNEFTLYHVTGSIRDRYTPENGLVKLPHKAESNSDAIFEGASVFFPQLKDATIVESRVVHRGVQAHREFDDKRVAELYDHGFGCFSILSGKIVSSAHISSQLANIVRRRYLA